MDYSLPGWLGALAGMMIAVAVYVPAIRVLERRLRARNGPMTLGQRAAFEDKVSVVRRVILGIDIAIFAVAGYWVGKVIGGPGALHHQL